MSEVLLYSDGKCKCFEEKQNKNNTNPALLFVALGTWINDLTS